MKVVLIPYVSKRERASYIHAIDPMAAARYQARRGVQAGGDGRHGTWPSDVRDFANDVIIGS